MALRHFLAAGFRGLWAAKPANPAGQASDGSVTTAYTSILVAPGPAGQVFFQLIPTIPWPPPTS
jgi:hypothetical protein